MSLDSERKKQLKKPTRITNIEPLDIFSDRTQQNNKKIQLEPLGSRRSNSSRSQSVISRRQRNTLDYSFTKNKFRTLDSDNPYEVKNRKVYDNEYLE